MSRRHLEREINSPSLSSVPVVANVGASAMEVKIQINNLLQDHAQRFENRCECSIVV